MKNKILIAGGLFLAWYLYQSQSFSKFVKARFTGIKFNLSRTQQNIFTQLWFDVGLQIANPTAFTVNLRAVSLDVIYNGKKIGNVEILGEKSLKAFSENSVNVPASVPTFAIFSSVQSAIKAISDKKPIIVNIRGVISTSSGNVEINENLQLL
jgi:hypothetical protein